MSRLRRWQLSSRLLPMQDQTTNLCSGHSTTTLRQSSCQRPQLVSVHPVYSENDSAERSTVRRTQQTSTKQHPLTRATRTDLPGLEWGHPHHPTPRKRTSRKSIVFSKQGMMRAASSGGPREPTPTNPQKINGLLAPPTARLNRAQRPRDIAHTRPMCDISTLCHGELG